MTIARCVIFKTPLSTSASQPGCSIGGRSHWQHAGSVSWAHWLQLTSRHLHILFHKAYNFRLDHVIFFRLFTQVRLWLTARSRLNMEHSPLLFFKMSTSGHFPHVLINLSLHSHLTNNVQDNNSKNTIIITHLRRQPFNHATITPF